MVDTETPATSEKEALSINYIHRLGVLFGVAATLLGGGIGALAGRLTKKFSAANGFVGGTVIAGIWTGGAQILSHFRLKEGTSSITSRDSDNSLIQEAIGLTQTPDQGFHPSGKHRHAVEVSRVEATAQSRG